MEPRDYDSLIAEGQLAIADILVARDRGHLRRLQQKLIATQITLERALAAYKESRELLARLDSEFVLGGSSTASVNEPDGRT